MTSLQGHIEATYAALVATFGEPFRDDGSGDGKTDVEWEIKLPSGKLVYLYNWKNGKNYLGPDGKDVKDITDWNVGGDSKDDVVALQLMIEQTKAAYRDKLNPVDRVIIDSSEAVSDVYDSISGMHGEQYAHVVSGVVAALKATEIVAVLCKMLEQTDVPRVILDKIGDAHSAMMSEVVAPALASVDDAEEPDAECGISKQVLEWASMIDGMQRKAGHSLTEILLKKA